MNNDHGNISDRLTYILVGALFTLFGIFFLIKTGIMEEKIAAAFISIFGIICISAGAFNIKLFPQRKED